jgi:hypothetical protein
VIIGFTGTRFGPTPQQRKKLFLLLKLYAKDCSYFHHGGCWGADITARDLARELHIPTVCHPGSDWQWETSVGTDRITLPQKPYLERDKDIAVEVELLIAVSKTMTEEKKSGTWATVRAARKLNKRIIVCWPDGTATEDPAYPE